MICGLDGRYMNHLRHLRDVVGSRPGVSDAWIRQRGHNPSDTRAQPKKGIEIWRLAMTSGPFPSGLLKNCRKAIPNWKLWVQSLLRLQLCVEKPFRFMDAA